MTSSNHGSATPEQLVNDPATSAELLSKIAADYPHLRAAILVHPNCYPGLQEWIRQYAHAPAVTEVQQPQSGAVNTHVPQTGANPVVSAGQPVYAEQASVASGALPVSPGKRSKRPIIIAAITLIAFAAGAATYFLWWNKRDDGDTTVAPSPSVSPSALTSDYVLPYFVNKSLDSVLTELEQAGYSSNEITISYRKWVDPAGVVLEQTPAVGTTGAATIALVVSEAVDVPNLVGLDETFAVAQLDTYGASARIVDVYVDGAEAGTVQSSQPAAGEVLGRTVVLEVARPLSSIGLIELDPVSEVRCATVTAAKINGEAYTDSLACDGSNSWNDYTRSEIVYVLDRNTKRLTATLGVSDTVKDATAKFRVEIIGDNETLAHYDAVVGKPVDIDVDTTNVLRLTIRGTLIEHADSSTSTYFLGTPRIYGEADLLERLKP